jgi:hypothetical protein
LRSTARLQVNNSVGLRAFGLVRGAMHSNPRLHDYGWRSALQLYRALDALRLRQIFSSFVMTRKFEGGTISFRPLLANEMLMATGLYEPFVKEVFKPKEGEVVIDVGAYIGLYTILAAQAVGPSGKVISIEPNPGLFRYCRETSRRTSSQT